MTSTLIRKPSPTLDTANRLQRAFDIFNEHLFDNELPPAMLKIERLRGANGIYRPVSYSDKSHNTIPSIALNSTNVIERDLDLLMSTLASAVHNLLMLSNSSSAV